MTVSNPLVSLRGVSRTFGEDSSGIREIDLFIQRGELVAIVGPSGAGKTTLLGIIGLLDRPDTGAYYFDGIDVGAASEAVRNRIRARSIGFVFQSAFVLGDESVLDNAALGLRVQGVPVQERYSRALRSLERVGILGRAHIAAKDLSGGERQRLAVARALAPLPQLILADEPTGSLDSANGQRVLDDLLALNAAGTTIVLITHDEQLAARADRQLRIVDGQIVADTAHCDVLPSVVRPAGVPTDRPRSLIHRAALTFADDLADAMSSLARRALRAGLLIAAFALGIGGLVAALGVTESAAAQVTDRLTAAALDEVRVLLPGGAELLHSGSELDEWIHTAAELPYVVDVGYVVQVSATSARIGRLGPTYSEAERYIQVIAASPAYIRMMGAKPIGTDTLNLLLRTGGIAFIGEGASENLKTPVPGPGASIWVGDQRVSLVGELRAGERDASIDNTVVVSPDVIVNAPMAMVTLVVHTEVGFPAPLARALPLALDPADPGRFQVETVADLRDLRAGVAGDLGGFVGMVSLVLLALATIGASTTMYLSVYTRGHEIALRRALGASRMGVARLFLFEGVVVGVLGGAAGAILGIFATLTATSTQGWSPVLPDLLAPLSIALGIATGLASAFVPAIAAGRREPAAAIRG